MSHPESDGYAEMRQAHDVKYEGEHNDAPQVLNMLERMGLLRTESMTLVNDPRFFQGNVIDKRLQAFAGLGVISGLLVATSIDQIFNMKKDMILTTGDGFFQFVGFFLMTSVLFCNTLATYVTVAQSYHTYRLISAGPNGFEMATSYYLNKNMVFWRHLAIKCMLSSLPLFLMSSGIRMLVKFDKDEMRQPTWVSIGGHEPSPLPPPKPQIGGYSLLGCGVCLTYITAGCILSYIDKKHRNVFRERYALVMERERPLLTHFQSEATRHLRTDRSLQLDV